MNMNIKILVVVVEVVYKVIIVAAVVIISVHTSVILVVAKFASMSDCSAAGSAGLFLTFREITPFRTSSRYFDISI